MQTGEIHQLQEHLGQPFDMPLPYSCCALPIVLWNMAPTVSTHLWIRSPCQGNAGINKKPTCLLAGPLGQCRKFAVPLMPRTVLWSVPSPDPGTQGLQTCRLSQNTRQCHPALGAFSSLSLGWGEDSWVVFIAINCHSIAMLHWHNRHFRTFLYFLFEKKAC